MALAMSLSASSLSFGRSVADVQRLGAAPASSKVAPRAPVQVESMVKIRFTRLGRKRKPFYRIIAVDSRTRRDGKPLELLGWYDPMVKQSSLNAPAIKKWLAAGPTETVENLLKKALIIEQK